MSKPKIGEWVPPTLEEIVLQTFESLVAQKKISIEVNVEPEYARSGGGQWNVTKTYMTINGTQYCMEDGRVELIEPE